MRSNNNTAVFSRRYSVQLYPPTARGLVGIIRRREYARSSRAPVIGASDMSAERFFAIDDLSARKKFAISTKLDGCERNKVAPSSALRPQLPEITAAPFAVTAAFHITAKLRQRRPLIEFGRTQLSVLCSITRRLRYCFSTRPVLLEYVINYGSVTLFERQPARS